jgi:hypothetical protein
MITSRVAIGLIFVIIQSSSLHADILGYCRGLFFPRPAIQVSYPGVSSYFPNTFSRLQDLADEALDWQMAQWSASDIDRAITSIEQKLALGKGVGLHYNRSGGIADQYVDAGEIRATLGDDFLQGLAMSGPGSGFNVPEQLPSVFFYHLRFASISTIIKKIRPRTFILFRIKDVPGMRWSEDGYYRSKIEFAGAQSGVPTSAWLLPPIDLGSFIYLNSSEYLIRSIYFLHSVVFDAELEQTFAAENAHQDLKLH